MDGGLGVDASMVVASWGSRTGGDLEVAGLQGYKEYAASKGSRGDSLSMNQDGDGVHTGSTVNVSERQG